jgi:DNA-binding Lrp family transcriptional regulator
MPRLSGIDRATWEYMMPLTRLDPIDRLILAELQADGRMTNGLQSQAESDLRAFEDRCREWPLVRECHMLNGEVDFMLKCVAPDLSTFQSFLTEELLCAENVGSVKTSLVIRGSKDDPGVPFEVLEERLTKQS